ncbi:MAG: hypothetical protein HY695_11660 [Deltaproteobacteria bacterium]|nr:hypothetical protein [Deltaproteobacteria bacterium]
MDDKTPMADYFPAASCDRSSERAEGTTGIFSANCSFVNGQHSALTLSTPDR